jgi:hypothetical protein
MQHVECYQDIEVMYACVDNPTGYGAGAGGVAYVNVWGASNHFYQPAYVFPAQLGNGAPKYTVSATV